MGLVGRLRTAVGRFRRYKAAGGEESSEKSDPAAPPGQRLYAIGDIHGRADLLDQLHDLILKDRAGADAETQCIAIYLGDYIDRGPDSRAVIDRLVHDPLPGFETVHLCGNHDDFLLRFLEDPSIAPLWLANGGDATLSSYGIESAPSLETTADLSALRDDLLAHLPDDHRRFFRALAYRYTAGDYFFTHAGVRPGIGLDIQDPYDLMWIREEFLNSRADFGKVVVHGHTPAEAVEDRPNRIGIDTGAVFTGRLSCAVLEGPERRFLATA